MDPVRCDDEMLMQLKEMAQSALRERVGAMSRSAEAERAPGDPLFADHDRVRGAGQGFFSFDYAERLSRRIDLRHPDDENPGPMEMEEAPPELEGDAIELQFDDDAASNDEDVAQV